MYSKIHLYEMNSKNFQRENKSPDVIIDEHKKFLSSVGIKMDKDNDAINLTDANLSNLKFDHLCLIFLY